MSETDDKTWAVGVELSDEHQGVLRFTACLADANDTVVAVHVMPDSERIHPLVTQELSQTMRGQITRDVALMLERAGVRARTDIRVFENDQPERGLIELTESEQFDALIVGRRARSDDAPLIRLGEICRRVLRKLPGPVIVVPPDFGEDENGGDENVDVDPGPVVLATDLEPHGAAAAGFAAMLAKRLDRRLLVAHGIAAFNWGVSYIPAESFEIMLEQARDHARSKLHAWVDAQGLGGAEEHVFMGDPARNVAVLVEERRAAALVTGSRKLRPLERIFLASISSELAASAGCPIAIVPG